MDTELQRETLLFATLPHVTFDGWSERALRAGAEDAGIDPLLAANAFPGGASDLVAAFSAWADAEALRRLEGMDLEAMKIRERIAAGVRTRLEVLEPHREAVRRGLSFLSLPSQAALALRLLYRTVDALWYAAGDRSTDYNFYTKRLLLSGVYSSTLLAWLNDKSEDKAETWAFLERRIDEVLKVGGRLGKGMKTLLDLPDRLAAGKRPRFGSGLSSRLFRPNPRATARRRGAPPY